MKKILSMLMVVSSMCFFIQATTVSAATSLLTWDLVDSGKHLDWDGGTALTQFSTAVTTWNNYKAGVIRPDTPFITQDVAISDYSDASGYAGVTSAAGTIKFNSYFFSSYTSADKLNLCLHELGHALRLEHNTINDVMYVSVTANIVLSQNDKDSYDLAYNSYY